MGKPPALPGRLPEFDIYGNRTKGAGIVKDLKSLGRYTYTGHSVRPLQNAPF